MGFFNMYKFCLDEIRMIMAFLRTFPYKITFVIYWQSSHCTVLICNGNINHFFARHLSKMTHIFRLMFRVCGNVWCWAKISLVHPILCLISFSFILILNKGYNKYPFRHHRFVCQLTDHNLLSISFRDWHSLHLYWWKIIVGIKSWPRVERRWYF